MADQPPAAERAAGVRGMVSDAATALEEWTKELEEREAKLSEARTAFEVEQRRMTSDFVKPEDIIPINMGGEKTIKVKRSLLTQVEGSYLASMFSGRWEEQITRDSEGNIFVDESPEVFMSLIEWLRARRYATEEDPATPATMPQIDKKYEKAWVQMMEYYGLPVEKKMYKVIRVATGNIKFLCKLGATSRAVPPMFLHRSRGHGNWNQFCQGTAEDGWWASSEWSISNKHYEIQVLVDGEVQHTWDCNALTIL